MSATARVHQSIQAIPEEVWDGMLGAPGEEAPFTRHAFFRCLEDAGVIGGRGGHAAAWRPRYLTLEEGGRVVAAAPAFLKLDSQGEFVFDFAFAELAAGLGVRYYPKLLVGVPFTPVTGPRLLTDPLRPRPPLLAALVRAILDLANGTGLSSVHLNFARADEVAACVEGGMGERHGLQYHWHRREARSFDDYLGRFNSKRRNQLKREHAELARQGLEIVRLAGDQLSPDDLALAFELYQRTVDKFVWGRQYLNPRFFALAAERLGPSLELLLARERGGGPVVAGAVNFASNRRLYGRYWGAREERRFLHFNVCYYRGVEECCARGLEVFEPGAGGEHKLVRGFEPTIQRSAHWFADPRLADAARRGLARERAAIAAEQEAMREALGLRKE